MKAIVICAGLIFMAVPTMAMDHYTRALQDQNGRAISGATVTVYMGGSTVLATLYSDNGVTVKSNPFTTGIDGIYDFYAANGVYDITFVSPRNIYSADKTKGIMIFDTRDGPFNQVTALPNAPILGQIIQVMDDPTSGACDSSGGSQISVCMWDGVGWIQITGGGAGGDGWPTVNVPDGVTWANSLANAFKVGKDTSNYWALYHDATDGLQLVGVCAGVVNGCNYIRKLESGKSFIIQNAAGSGLFTLTQAGVLTLNATLQKTSQPFAVPLSPRGAAGGAYESIVSNQPTEYYITVTDANTDAVDFSFDVTAEMAGKTAATFRLVGVSKNAAPANNIDFDCAMKRYAPGTDTFVAHSTTGEVTALLTPATQNRPVAVTTSAHTINGGALVAGDVVYGSCEVDATATTSTQMTDFRLRGWVLVTLN